MPLSRRKTKLLVEEISRGAFSTVTNLVLFSLFYGAEYVGGASPTSRGVWRAHNKALEDLASLDLTTVKNALNSLRAQGLIETAKGKRIEHKITAAGRKKLRSALPVYDARRQWDGKIYLVTYDVPEKQRVSREILRDFILKRLGCAMLQKSVWLTVYNPTSILEEFVREHRLQGLVLVSSLGKDGSVGQKSVRDLVSDLYQLKRLNDDYKAYIWEYDGKKIFNRSAAVFEFLSILQRDPQLPFELLPRGWKGGEAYDLFREILSGSPLDSFFDVG